MKILTLLLMSILLTNCGSNPTVAKCPRIIPVYVTVTTNSDGGLGRQNTAMCTGVVKYYTHEVVRHNKLIDIIEKETK